MACDEPHIFTVDPEAVQFAQLEHALKYAVHWQTHVAPSTGLYVLGNLDNDNGAVHYSLLREGQTILKMPTFTVEIVCKMASLYEWKDPYGELVG